MCEIIERIEAYGVDLELLQSAADNPRHRTEGKWSPHSVTLIVLRAVEDEWKRLTEAGEPAP